MACEQYHQGVGPRPGPKGWSEPLSVVMGWRCLMLAAKPRQLSRDEVNSAFSLVRARA